MKFACPLVLLSTLITTSAHGIVIANKDWMQVSQTAGYSWNQIDTIFDDSTGQCDVSNCSLGSVDLTGYIWASAVEVDDMISTFTGQHLTFNNGYQKYDDVGTNNIENFFSTFNALEVTTYRQILEGHTRNTFPKTGSTAYSRAIGVVDIKTEISLDDYVLTGSSTKQYSRSGTGGWFYKPANATTIPEPSSLALLIFGLLSFSYRRHLQNRF